MCTALLLYNGGAVPSFETNIRLLPLEIERNESHIFYGRCNQHGHN
jgi:hypothetical protein